MKPAEADGCRAAMVAVVSATGGWHFYLTEGITLREERLADWRHSSGVGGSVADAALGRKRMEGSTTVLTREGPVEGR